MKVEYRALIKYSFYKVEDELDSLDGGQIRIELPITENMSQ